MKRNKRFSEISFLVARACQGTAFQREKLMCFDHGT